MALIRKIKSVLHIVFSFSCKKNKKQNIYETKPYKVV